MKKYLLNNSLFNRAGNKIIVVLLMAITCSALYAQPSQEGKVHAAMLYNIVKYFEWPNNNDAGQIEIAVLGNDDVFEALKANYDGKPVGNKKCIVKKVENTSDIAQNSIIYIGKSKSKEFDAIKGLAANKSLLTVTEKEDLGAKGSCINFIIVDGRLKFQLNRNAVATSNLKVLASLVSMAILI